MDAAFPVLWHTQSVLEIRWWLCIGDADPSFNFVYKLYYRSTATHILSANLQPNKGDNMALVDWLCIMKTLKAYNQNAKLQSDMFSFKTLCLTMISRNM